MKKALLLLLTCLFCAISAAAQTVTVVDEESGEPLSGVNIYTPDESTSAVTDSRGNADLSGFEGENQIIFSYVGYFPRVLRHRDLEELDYSVALEKRAIALEQMVVAASRWEENSREVATRITRIEPQEVRLQNPQTAADLIGISNEVFVQKSQMGGGSPMIRGFASNRVLLVVDGVRMNNAIFRSGNLQNVISLDPNILSNSEVIFGPGSVLYGSDAIGGVMSFNSRKPTLGFEGQREISATAMSRLATANEEKTGHVSLGIGFDRWALLSGITYTDYGHQRMGSHGRDTWLREEYVQRVGGSDLAVENDDPRVQIPTGYRQLNLMQKVRYRPTNRWDIEAGVHWSTTSNIPRYDRLIERENGTFRHAQWYYGPQFWVMGNLQVNWFKETPLFENVRLVTSYQNFGESRHDRRFGEDLLRHRTESVRAWSANIDFEKSLSDESTLFYGMEGIWNGVGSEAYRENITDGTTAAASTRYPDDSTWESYALFASYKNNLSEWWTVTLGARYNHYLIHAPFDDPQFSFPFGEADINRGALTGSLGAVLRPDDSWQINATLSSGFRAPNIDDIGKIFDSEPGIVIVPNPNLEPEYAYNADLGFAHTFSDYMKVDATLFHTWLENAMARRPFTLGGQEEVVYDGVLSEVEAIQNVAHARVWGIQGGVDLFFTPRVELATRLNWQRGKELEGEGGGYVPSRHVAPLFGSSRLRYMPDRWTFDLSVDYNGQIPYSELAPSERNKPHLYAEDANGNPFSPSWMTVNLKTAFELSDAIDLFAGIENITDRRYQPYSSGVTAPGRNFIFSVRGSI